MATRARDPGLDVNVKDEARVYKDVIEPFMYQLQQPPEDKGVKLIFWFIAAIDEENPFADASEAAFKVAAFGYDEALSKLTFDNDRQLVTQAIAVVEQTQE